MNFWFDPPDLPSDIDGNYFNEVTIGTQIWMGKNLEVTHYNDGTTIPYVSSNGAWEELMEPGYCWYNNEIINKETYGGMYNWYAVDVGNLCPVGWHVPSEDEWNTLSTFLGVDRSWRQT